MSSNALEGHSNHTLVLYARRLFKAAVADFSALPVRSIGQHVRITADALTLASELGPGASAPDKGYVVRVLNSARDGLNKDRLDRHDDRVFCFVNTNSLGESTP